MKFHSIVSFAVSALFATSAVLAEDVQQEQANAASRQEPENSESIKFLIDYDIKEYPEVSNTNVAELKNGEVITLQYNAVNNEEEDITVVGVGGTFRNPANNKIVTNLTAATIGPIVIKSGESVAFDQKVNLELVPDNYMLTPQVFIAYKEELKLIQTRGQLASVNDVPISFFNPQLLFLELIIGLTLAGFGYFAWLVWGQAYFQGTSPIRSKKISAPIAVSTGSKTVNEDWLPPNHLQNKKKKTRKAY